MGQTEAGSTGLQGQELEPRTPGPLGALQASACPLGKASEQATGIAHAVGCRVEVMAIRGVPVPQENGLQLAP